MILTSINMIVLGRVLQSFVFLNVFKCEKFDDIPFEILRIVNLCTKLFIRLIVIDKLYIKLYR